MVCTDKPLVIAIVVLSALATPVTLSLPSDRKIVFGLVESGGEAMAASAENRTMSSGGGKPNVDGYSTVSSGNAHSTACG